MRKRVYIAYTGGTIGMKKAAGGYVPVPGYLQMQMENIPELKSAALPVYDIHEYDPLLDSSNMTPRDWLKIAEDIASHYDSYDGFVVLHGTDTMAYTASALPFMLQNLQKPVILTGAQIPLCELRNDARENLITAMLIAANFAIPEVCLCFGSKLLRGNRAIKVDADGFDAFDSPNFPQLGSLGIVIKINRDLILRPVGRPKRVAVQPIKASSVAVLRLFPGISADIVRNILQPPIEGLVLETYGMGNGPEDRALIAELKEAVKRGVVIINCTQCIKGTVNMEDYATGSALAEAGLISGYDMTVEAALAKLAYLFGLNLPPEAVKEKIQLDLRGELSRPHEAQVITPS
ncbi:MAG: asparaginase [Desulfobacterales bacterium]|nr:MAG: asparaginase [Desulfobacterales bacterium]